MAHTNAAFDANVRRLIYEWHVPGLGVAIVQGDEIQAKYYGVARLDGGACTEDTLFDCASTSKSFTAACIALLVDDDSYPDVQWRTPVSQILPDDFVLPDPYRTANVTIEDILSHRTGDPGHDNALHGQSAAEPDNAKSITRNLRNLPFNKPLRCDYQYSNIMFTVATHLIETVTGIAYSEFIRKRLWEPLGMSNTYHDVTGVEAGNAQAHLAMGHRWVQEKETYLAMPSYAQPEGQGAGCVFSSAGDYAKWVRALLQRSGPLSAGAHNEMVKGRIIVPFEGNDALPLYGHSVYALGLIAESYRGHMIFGHDGSFGGFRALMRFLPGHNWGIVVFGNSNDAFYVHQILFHQLVDEVLRVPQEERTDWPAYWRKCHEDGEREEAEEDPDLLPPDWTEPLLVPLEDIAGEYFNAGYRTIILSHNKGSLEAKCRDRCTAFDLRFDHLSGDKFVVEFRDVLENTTRKMKAEFKIDSATVQSFGIPLCDEMKDELIWFHKRS
ncbi:beta-lactamase/transpeptidase-like protein [Boeremia exigua]|uniref:beta-lactamase/transpeptidase-like protein n=1 Tax=Boeremia exigua TaxID=749465 RepID=UPI001E8E4B43|nr:beta-lactamase/transpeptidase-like protein [Boeremia exigua]KAH6644565.1 beta-lactamase/transpeptidase-like protein [Boeremia exigua]